MARMSSGRSADLERAFARLVLSEAALVENQSAFLSQQSSFLAQLTEHRQRMDRIERELEQIRAILLRHEQILNDLTEAIRQKIGFESAPGSQAPPSSS